jgi:hypothetical protein
VGTEVETVLTRFDADASGYVAEGKRAQTALRDVAAAHDQVAKESQRAGLNVEDFIKSWRKQEKVEARNTKFLAMQFAELGLAAGDTGRTIAHLGVIFAGGFGVGAAVEIVKWGIEAIVEKQEQAKKAAEAWVQAQRQAAADAVAAYKEARRLTEGEVDVAEENEGADAAAEAEPSGSLRRAEDAEQEPSRLAPRRRALHREVACELVELLSRARLVCSRHTLRELLERQSSRSSVLAQRDHRPLAICIGRAQLELVHASTPICRITSTTFGAASAPWPSTSACFPWPSGTTSRSFSSFGSGRVGSTTASGFDFARSRPGTDG